MQYGFHDLCLAFMYFCVSSSNWNIDHLHASDSPATYGTLQMCFDWLIDWLISDSSLLGQTSLLDCKDNHYGNNLSHAVWNLCTMVSLLGPKSVARAMGATSLRRSTMPVSCPFHGCNALLRIVKRSYIKYHAFAFFLFFFWRWSFAACNNDPTILRV